MRGSLLRRRAALTLAAALAVPLAPAGAAPEDAPPPRQVFDCSNNPAPTRAQLVNVALAFSAAWACTSGYDPVPFPLTDLNGYGCYCGSGSTGLDTAPVDGYDTCCRQHDIDWTALCRNVADPTRPGQGCDCYVNVPRPTGCANQVPTYPANLNACQQACAEELTKQFTCYARWYNDSNYRAPDLSAYRNQCEWQHHPNPQPLFGDVGPGRPFDGILPSYCRKSTQPLPTSVFGPYDPGTNVFKDGCSCELDNATCSGKVSGCARSAAACRALGGTPGNDCALPMGCTVNVDVTSEPCGYRSPNSPCPCEAPPNAAEICDLDAAVGDACNPCTGQPGSGGTCEQGIDLLVCTPNPPQPSPSPSPSPTSSPSPVPTPSAPPQSLPSAVRPRATD